MWIVDANGVQMTYSEFAETERVGAALNQFYVRWTRERVIEDLCGWVPDKADSIALRGLMGSASGPARIITAIKFARLRSGASLKEAKDWVEKHFSDRV